jgi:hypothetical protein
MTSVNVLLRSENYLIRCGMLCIEVILNVNWFDAHTWTDLLAFHNSGLLQPIFMLLPILGDQDSGLLCTEVAPNVNWFVAHTPNLVCFSLLLCSYITNIQVMSGINRQTCMWSSWTNFICRNMMSCFMQYIFSGLLWLEVPSFGWMHVYIPNHPIPSSLLILSISLATSSSSIWFSLRYG